MTSGRENWRYETGGGELEGQWRTSGVETRSDRMICKYLSRPQAVSGQNTHISLLYY